MSLLRRVLGVAAIVATLAMLVPMDSASAYCNTDPCRNGGRIVCSSCDYVVIGNFMICTVRWIYCVDCRAGEFIHDSEEWFCIPWIP